MDPQAGLLENINSNEGNYYFKDINYEKSFIVRLDNKTINKDLLKYKQKHCPKCVLLKRFNREKYICAKPKYSVI